MVVQEKSGIFSTLPPLSQKKIATFQPAYPRNSKFNVFYDIILNFLVKYIVYRLSFIKIKEKIILKRQKSQFLIKTNDWKI